MGLLEGAGILLMGMLVGRFWPAHKRMRASSKPICGCKHDLSFHDPESGECHGTIKGAYYVNGRWMGNQRPCVCRQYTGPQPLTEYFAPEITD